jgi:hypothetical protein
VGRESLDDATDGHLYGGAAGGCIAGLYWRRILMALLPRHRTPPVFQPIIERERAVLTIDEQRLLEAYRDVYPHLEYTETRSQMNRLVLERWLWRNGDNDA